MQQAGGQRTEGCSLPPPNMELEVGGKEWKELEDENGGGGDDPNMGGNAKGQK